ncbi:MAG: cation diffusion facilitator family transporter [Acidimicrobiaceae bacterium]|nr:cation diffusion facilitator family transporter [Acidimicrobiaceae bacterium]
MSGDGGTTKTIVVAFISHTIVASLKFLAWGLTGSASMLSSGVHSIASITDQAALLRGRKLSKRQADEDHPFGYARERYVVAFLVSLVVFTVGGLYALWQAYSKAMSIHAGHPSKLLTSHFWWVPIPILVGALTSSAWSFRVAVRTMNIHKGNKSWRRFIATAKTPEHPVVLLEDIGSLSNLSAALFGVVMSKVTHNAYFDAIGSALIGVSLIGVGYLMVSKTWSMLIGEGSSRASLVRVRAVLAATDGVLSVKRFRSLHIGPEELMVVAQIVVDSDKSAQDVATIIDRADAAIRRVEPAVTRLYLEPAIGLRVRG